MQKVIASWGGEPKQLDSQAAKAWLALAHAAGAAGGVLSLDPRNTDHAAHIEARLGDDAQLAAYFPRKAQMLAATAAAFELNGGAPHRTLLHMTPEEAGCEQRHPYVGVPHLTIDPYTNSVTATGVVSHPKLLQALETVLEVFDADTGERLGATSIPAQFNTHSQRATVTAPLGEGVATSRRLVAGMTTNFVVDGEPYANPMLATAALEGVNVISSVTPFAPLPVKHPGASQVTIAIARNGLDVDYTYYPAPAPNEIIVPFSGQAVLASGWSVGSPPCQTGSLVLICTVAGGGVAAGAQYALSTADVVAAFSASQGSVATWTMGPDWQQTFPNAAGGATFNVQLQATLNVKSGGTPNTTSLTVSSFGSVSPGGQLLPLSIQWGCVAPWTPVAMAGGGERSIDQLRPGDRLCADASGRVVEVDRVITGEEAKPMWRLTAAGRDLLATHDHPVITPAGPVAIETLVEGDLVLTQDGPAPVVRIAPEAYAGCVVNLVLRLTDGAVPLRGDSFVASGMLIGDNGMQNALVRGAPVQGEAPGAVPLEWSLDAANARRRAEGLPLVAVA